LLKIADEVVPLKNIGREGATYLVRLTSRRTLNPQSHIVRHYPTGHVDFARHTLFLQPHLAWDWVMKPRLSKVHKSTGFMSFGPYINMTEGVDVHGNTFSRINDIYAMFRQDLHPPHTLLATWAGQFIVSRKRLLDNTFKSYRNLLSVFEAPEDHWIWKEGWWNSQPSDPTLGKVIIGSSADYQVTLWSAAGQSFSIVQMPEWRKLVEKPPVRRASVGIKSLRHFLVSCQALEYAYIVYRTIYSKHTSPRVTSHG